MKKNPFMSIALSAAYRVGGAARAQASALVKRQTRAAMTEASDEALRFWTWAMQAPVVTARTPRKR